MLPTAPAHVFRATIRGSGKTFLNQIASIVATGRMSGLVSQGANDEENEKRLGASFRFGDPIIIIDNCTKPLGGDFLCSAMTSPRVKVRILGKSEIPELSTNSFIMANGNNLALQGDMCRRAVTCKLDPRTERPELRSFDRNPLDVARENRADYVAAVLTILRAFIVAGRPRQSTPLGSFEAWSELVRDSLLWLGEADPVSTIDEAQKHDPEIIQLEAVMTEWHAAFGGEKVTCQQVIARATEKRMTFDGSAPDFKFPAFREALLAIAGRGGAINSKALGSWISDKEGRPHTVDPSEEVDDFTDAATSKPRTHSFVRHGIIKGTLHWKLHTEDRAVAAQHDTVF